MLNKCSASTGNKNVLKVLKTACRREALQWQILVYFHTLFLQINLLSVEDSKSKLSLRLQSLRVKLKDTVKLFVYKYAAIKKK